MTNEFAKAQLADIMDALKRQMSMIADIRQRRTELTATASAEDARVAVTINADGTVIETRFADDVGDLTFDEIAAAVTRAAQQAKQNLAEQIAEVHQPLRDLHATLPSMSDLVANIPELNSLVSEVAAAPLEPPAGRSRAAENTAETMKFTDVEPYEHRRRTGGESDVADSLW